MLRLLLLLLQGLTVLHARPVLPRFTGLHHGGTVAPFQLLQRAHNRPRATARTTADHGGWRGRRGRGRARTTS